MIRKLSSIILSVLLLIGIAVGAIFWIQALNKSIERYQSPLVEASLSPQTTPVPKISNVVVVLVSGLGYDSAQLLNLPAFQQLAQQGADAAIFSFPPTYSQTSWATLISGAPPETNSAPPIDQSIEKLSLLEVDTIFARAHQAQQSTALLGPAEWQRLIPRNYLDETFFINTTGPEADSAIMEGALTLLRNDNINLIFVHLTQLDFAAQFQGGTSTAAYQQAAGRIDNCLEQISRAMDMSNQTLIIVSDHGHIPSGGHGGNEVDVVWQPLVMVGSYIVPGSYSDIYQTDIAPTITTLLGVAPPTVAQGRILFEMIQLNERDQATAQLLLAQQRVALAEAYTTQINGPDATIPEISYSDLAQAQNALTQKNIGGAFQLARLSQQESDTHMALVRANCLGAEQWPRLFVAAIVAVIWFTTMWRRRGAYVGVIIVATVVTVALYHTLYQIQGYSYSISSFTNLANLPFDIARRTGVSLLAGGGLVLIFLMLANEKNWVILLGTGYGFSVLITFIFTLPLFWSFWQMGFVVDWHLPGVVPLFWQITALHEAMVAAIMGLVIPWPIMLLNLLVNQTRRYLEQPQPESDAVPGLHL